MISYTFTVQMQLVGVLSLSKEAHHFIHNGYQVMVKIYYNSTSGFFMLIKFDSLSISHQIDKITDKNF